MEAALAWARPVWGNVGPAVVGEREGPGVVEAAVVGEAVADEEAIAGGVVADATAVAVGGAGAVVGETGSGVAGGVVGPHIAEEFAAAALPAEEEEAPACLIKERVVAEAGRGRFPRGIPVGPSALAEVVGPEVGEGVAVAPAAVEIEGLALGVEGEDGVAAGIGREFPGGKWGPGERPGGRRCARLLSGRGGVAWGGRFCRRQGGRGGIQGGGDRGWDRGGFGRRFLIALAAASEEEERGEGRGEEAESA